MISPKSYRLTKKKTDAHMYIKETIKLSRIWRQKKPTPYVSVFTNMAQLTTPSELQAQVMNMVSDFLYPSIMLKTLNFGSIISTSALRNYFEDA